jgi:hypothetical protein
VALFCYDGEHGRIETRSIRTLPISLGYRHGTTGKWYKALSPSRPKEKSITRSLETRYFISSLDANDPKRLERVVRAHGSIENNLHWVLDIAFDEDSNRTRKDIAPLTWLLSDILP